MKIIIISGVGRSIPKTPVQCEISAETTIAGTNSNTITSTVNAGISIAATWECPVIHMVQ